MPKRNDIHKVLVIGSGPIVIGQAAEFDYAGTQACLALKEEGYEVILANSNPATIMTDTSVADKVYMEPLTLEYLARICRYERPDAIVPGIGGQTGLNLAMQLAKKGVLKECEIELLGTDAESIERAEDRELFKELCESIGEPIVPSQITYSAEEALEAAEKIGYPVILRPAFTLGGTGGGFAYDPDEMRDMMKNALALSPVHQVLVEKSIKGYKEIEYEVIRDANDTAITVCNMENLDPVGIHTGDSIVVAPSQTLTNKEYQMLRDSALKIIRALGVKGGCNVQFALDPHSFRYYVIEVNPRVSRSSALASKASGYPIARVSAKIAVGMDLHEIQLANTPACFEPTIDYCVVKVPRFAFEKFKGTDPTLTTRMKAVGEIMAIGRTFEEAFGKAMRSLEDGHQGICAGGKEGADKLSDDELAQAVATPTEHRIFFVVEALRRGWDIAHIHAICGIDPWYLNRINDMVQVQESIRDLRVEDIDADAMRLLKQYGTSDAEIAALTGSDERFVRAYRKGLGVVPSMKTVDTCAAEFSSATEYHYKTYENIYRTSPDAKKCVAPDETTPADKPKAMILGAGPNRIGQGIEFDYCCVHASYALAARGFETIMVNCNPETVSTDYDTSDRLYFEPLTYEDVMDVIDVERPDGVVVTLGGQTPLKLARMLEESGVNIMGTKPDAIDFAEDRERFAALLDKLGIMYPPAGQATSFEEAEAVAAHIGYPLLVRPSYVLGGRGMMIAYDAEHLRDYMAEAARISPDYPVYLDRFLEGAIESDVDALCDGEEVYIGGILEHIEEAGIHSGDSATCIPPFSFSESLQTKLRETTRRIAMALGVRGLVNVQYAIKGETVYVIEANPRASRTVPFISKATGVPLAKCAARIMAGDSIASLGLPSDERQLDWFCMKEAVMPWGRFPGADVILGPEMKSTGEVMGIAKSYPEAYAKTQLAIDYKLPDPSAGKVFISVCDRDKRHILSVARILRYLGFDICSTEGTARVLRGGNVTCEVVEKISGPHDGERPNIGDLIADGKIAVIINTPYGPGSRGDGYLLRTEAVRRGVTCVTAMSAANTYVSAIEAVREDQQGHGSANDMGMDVIALQDLPQHTV